MLDRSVRKLEIIYTFSRADANGFLPLGRKGPRPFASTGALEIGKKDCESAKDGIVEKGGSMPARMTVMAMAVLIPVLLGGCMPSQRTYAEGILASDHKLMSKAELIRYQDRLEDEMVRVHTGGAVPGGATREVYVGDLRQRMKDVQQEIGLRNIWERKAWWERMEMNGPTH
jgi:hypothetical protein